MSKYLDETGLNEFWTQIKSKLATKAEATYTAGDNIDITNNTITGKLPVGYGTCNTAADTAAKVVTVTDDDFVIKPGTIIGVHFGYTNTASGVTLNVNNSGAAQIWYSNTLYTGSSGTYCGTAGRVNVYMWDGNHWVWISHGTDDNSNTVPMPHCVTAAATKAKTATCTYYALRADSYFPILFRYSNSNKTGITLNINDTGAKPIYIDGEPSSSTNYTLPAGIYIAYYDGVSYYINPTAMDSIPFTETISEKFDGTIPTNSAYDSYYPSIKCLRNNYGSRKTTISSTSDNTSVVTPKAVYDYVGSYAEPKITKLTNVDDWLSQLAMMNIDANAIPTSSTDNTKYYTVSAIKQAFAQFGMQNIDYADSWNIWDVWKDGFVSVSDKFYFTNTDYFQVTSNSQCQAVFYVFLMGWNASYEQRIGYIQFTPPALNGVDAQAPNSLVNWSPIEMGYVDNVAGGNGTKHVINIIDTSMLNTTVGATPSNSKILSEKAVTDYIASNTLLNSNKVTSITSSSTDTAIPSAKAVYDLFNDGMDEIGALIGTVSGS